MSGIVGILHLDGAPVDAAWLKRATAFLAFRGPDAQNTWVSGSVGFGHALLRTIGDSEPAQLLTRGDATIVADARIDARAELRDALAARGHAADADASDAELILRAWQAWGEECVAHLLGDFAFAIYHAPTRRLFCARDHFGVKPFFYAQLGNTVVFSNTLNAVRTHPAVSDKLNDLAIADFLLFGLNQDVATTSFADVQRLPPGHSITWSDKLASPSRYWTLPVEPPLRFRRPQECIDQFLDLFRAAVNDRLRTPRAGVAMSGGLDSSSVAAMAMQVSREQGQPLDLRAVTMVYDRLIPDRERHFAGVAARGLGIPIEFIPLDDFGLCRDFHDSGWSPPEPADSPVYGLATLLLLYERLAAHSRVSLTGEGGDPGLVPSLDGYLGWRAGELLIGCLRYLWSYGRWPRLGFRITFLRLIGREQKGWLFPDWLDRDLITRLNLRRRWKAANRFGILTTPLRHPARPYSYQALVAPYWPFIFEWYDPGCTRLQTQFRHPLFDVRVLRFLLRLPPVPWCADKELLRLAFRGLLPQEILRRPKAPLAGDATPDLLRQPGSAWVDQYAVQPLLARYVVRERVPAATAANPSEPYWMTLRPHSLNYWLQSLRANLTL